MRRPIFFLILALFTYSALATQQMVIFGDSYSDNGNTFKASHYTYPGQTYNLGRFSDGPTWSEYIAAKENINPMDPMKFRNYAYGQAQILHTVSLTTHAPHSQSKWQFDVPDLSREIDQYIKEGQVDPKNTIYYFFIGTNDFLNFKPTTHSASNDFMNQRLNALMKQITRVNQLGADHIIVFTLPNLALTPLAHQLNTHYRHNYLSNLNTMIQKFNKHLKERLARYPNITLFDIYDFDTSTTHKHPVYSWYRNTYTLSNTASPCYINKGNYVDHVNSPCANPWQYLYYDRVHLTTYANYILANSIYHVINTEK